MTKVEVFFNGIDENEMYSAAAARGSLAALRSEDAEGDIGIELTDNSAIHACNRDFRGVDRATDVLSFPLCEGEQLIGLPDGHLGDIMISVEMAENQAAELGHSTEREIMFLAIHGTLHILGYDHILPEDEEIMTKKQRDILKELEG